jgi:hypothetical protein
MGFRVVARRWQRAVLVVFISLITFVQALAAPSGRAAPQQQQDIAQITSPTEGQALAGLVTITGSTNHPEFARWELAYGPDPNPNDAWQPFASGEAPVENGVLGTWNTSVVADGGYMLRLRTVRRDSNYNETVVRGLKVSNSAPIEQPTSIPPAPTFPAEQATLPAEGTIQSLEPVMVEQPPTNPPLPTSAPNSPVNANQTTRRTTANAPALNAGLFGSACLNGLMLAAGLFVIVGAIQLGRWGVKQVRRGLKNKS